jgi:hypothetical protein
MCFDFSALSFPSLPSSQIDLSLLIGPIPIAFTLKPPMSILANCMPARAQAGSTKLGHQPSWESAGPSGLQDLGMLPSRVSSLVRSPWPLSVRIPQANFIPGSRSKSRLFLGFDSGVSDFRASWFKVCCPTPTIVTPLIFSVLGIVLFFHRPRTRPPIQLSHDHAHPLLRTSALILWHLADRPLCSFLKTLFVVPNQSPNHERLQAPWQNLPHTSSPQASASLVNGT